MANGSTDFSSLYGNYDPSQLTAAQGESQAAQRQADTYQSASALLPIKLREAVMEKLDYNKDLIEQQNKAMSEYFAAPSRAREKYQGIWNPFEREKLVTEERTQAYAPYATLTDILGQRMGSISDIIGAGTAGFQAATTAAQSAATAARQRYSDLFETAKSLVSAKQAEATHALDWYKATKPSGGGGGIDISDLFSLLGGGGTQPTEPQPMYTPSGAKKGSVSRGGEWVYVGTENYPNDWVSVYELEAIQ